MRVRLLLRSSRHRVKITPVELLSNGNCP